MLNAACEGVYPSLSLMAKLEMNFLVFLKFGHMISCNTFNDMFLALLSAGEGLEDLIP